MLLGVVSACRKGKGQGVLINYRGGRGDYRSREGYQDPRRSYKERSGREEKLYLERTGETERWGLFEL